MQFFTKHIKVENIFPNMSILGESHEDLISLKGLKTFKFRRRSDILTINLPARLRIGKLQIIDHRGVLEPCQTSRMEYLQ